MNPAGRDILYEELKNCLKERSAYKAELREKSPEELKALYEQEMSDDLDFEYWGKAAYWTLDEAIALSFGKNPQVVNWKKVERYVNVSPFVVQYAKIRDLALRAKNLQQLRDPLLPGMFLVWLERNKIDYPPQLKEQVTAWGHQNADWKSKYDEQKKQCDECSALLAAKETEIAELLEKPLLTKERQSALKLIMGMALGGYRYVPSER